MSRSSSDEPGGPVAATPRARRGLTALMFGCLVVGVVTMVLFESTPTRVVGVLCLFGFIVSGVFLIADPDFLAPEPPGEQERQTTA